MLSACERQLLFFYLSNAASRLHQGRPEGFGESGGECVQPMGRE